MIDVRREQLKSEIDRISQSFVDQLNKEKQECIEKMGQCEFPKSDESEKDLLDRKAKMPSKNMIYQN
jgi:hypothetical protein